MLSSFPIFPIITSWTQIAFTFLGVIGTILLGVYLSLWPYREYTLPFRNLDGPKGGHLLFGQFPAIIKAGPSQLQSRWMGEFGMTYRYRLLFGAHRFFSADPGAISYIFGHPDIFPKPDELRSGLKDMLGNGVLVAEGADHKRQRRALNPSFSGPAVRDMIPIFFDKAYDLKDMLLNMIDSEEETCPTPCKPEDQVTGAKKIDVLRYLGQ
ncbi:MAG: hypothetical protein TREMPRED_006032, partial [Tremellales sp. Tagirdzhanova-0007]